MWYETANMFERVFIETVRDKKVIKSNGMQSADDVDPETVYHLISKCINMHTLHTLQT